MGFFRAQSDQEVQAAGWLIVHADDDTFDDVVARSELPVLLLLWAPDGGPCHLLGHTLMDLADDFSARFTLVKVNVAESPELFERFGVTGVPTLIVIGHGEVVARRTGAAPQPVLADWLEKSLLGV